MSVEYGRLIHSNSARAQQRFVEYFDFFDCVTSLSSEYQDNSFVLSMPISEWKAHPIHIGEWIFIPGTEYGGRVQRLRNMAGQTVEVEGYGVRGWMSKWVIQPDDDHLVISGQDANAAIKTVAQGRLNAAFFDVKSSSSGITVSGQYLHQDVHYAINHLLDSAGARMDIKYDDDAAALIEAVSVTDYSHHYDFSQDYGAKLSTDQDMATGYNCIVAYGQGELSMREKTVWYLVDGNLTQTPPDVDLCEIREYYYDYSSVESFDELDSEAQKKLREIRDKASISIDLTGLEIELNLGDVVGARDFVTGLAFVDSVYSKILRIEGGKTTLNYRMKGSC